MARVRGTEATDSLGLSGTWRRGPPWTISDERLLVKISPSFGNVVLVRTLGVKAMGSRSV